MAQNLALALTLVGRAGRKETQQLDSTFSAAQNLSWLWVALLELGGSLGEAGRRASAH